MRIQQRQVGAGIEKQLSDGMISRRARPVQSSVAIHTIACIHVRTKSYDQPRRVWPAQKNMHSIISTQFIVQAFMISRKFLQSLILSPSASTFALSPTVDLHKIAENCAMHHCSNHLSNNSQTAVNIHDSVLLCWQCSGQWGRKTDFQAFTACFCQEL